VAFLPNTKVPTPDFDARNWHLLLDAIHAAFDAAAGVGPLCPSAPALLTGSASLAVDVAAGTFRTVAGALGDFAGGSVTAAPSATTRVWLTEAGVLASGPAWPSANFVPVAVAVAAATAVTSLADARCAFSAVVPGGGGL
jgi:hypothetical protein